jgi:hypothetical protein
MGSSSKQATTTQQTDPYAPAQPFLQQSLNLAGDAAANTYNGTGVAPLDALVTQGQNQAIANANTGALGNLGTQEIGNVGQIMANGGLSQQQSDAASGIGSALTGFNSAMGSAQGALNPYVSGQYLNQPNPYLQKAVDTSMQDAANGINRQFSAAGRYGSGANTQVLADRLGNIANTAYMNDYNQQQQNQLNAVNSLGSLAGAGLNGNLSGLGAIGNIGQQGYQNTLAGAQAATPLSQAQNTDANTLASIGSQNMAYQQQLIDAANQNPWLKAGNLAQISGGIAGLGGTQSGTSTATQQNDPLSTIFGGLLAGAGVLGNAKSAGFKLF